MVKKNVVDMLDGSIFKGLLSLTMPIMIMNVAQSLFNIVDLIVLGNLVDDSAVGSVGACGTLITLCTGFLIGVATGANVIVARHIGEKDREHTDKAIGSAVLFALVAGVIMMLVGIFCAETFLRWMNCPENLLAGAVTYFRLYFLGVPFILMYNFCASILRATGDTKRPMYFLILSSVLKVSLNIFFITVCHLTVEGVALATVVSNGVACALAFLTLCRGNAKAQFHFKNLRMDMQELRDILYIGVPTGLQSALYAFANVIIMTTVNGFGSDATTGISIANQFDNILYVITQAPALAAMPYIAQNIGARQFKRARQATLRAIFISSAFGLVFGSLSAIFSAQLASTMTASPAIIGFAQDKMMLISSTYFICAINEILGGALKGMGKPILPTVATMVFMCGIRFVWVYFVFPLCPNLTFLYLIWPIGWILSIITLLIAYFPAMRKLEKSAELS